MAGTFQVFTIPAGVPQGGMSAPMASGVFPRWSSNGRFLYLLAEDRASLLTIVASGGEPSEAFAWPRGGAVRQRRVHWIEMAPAERAFAYTWMEGEAVAGTSVVDRATGQENGLSLPLAQFRWSHDGNSIVGTHLALSGRPATGRVVVCVALPGDCRKVATGYFAAPSADRRRVLFSRLPSDPLSPASLWTVGLDGNGEVKVAELPEPLPQSLSFDVSRNGQIVYSRFVQDRAELWPAELR